MDRIRFYLNDEEVSTADVAPTTTLLEFLRQHLHQTGTKEGCAEGDCGACTVAVLDADAPGGATFRAINSCLLLLPMVQGKRIYTVEGLRGEDQQHHPVQVALAEALGSQCGYCTPGVVMSMFEACYRQDVTEAWQLDDQMCGNLCRCTGYRPIRLATRVVTGSHPDDRFRARLEGDDHQDSPAVDYTFGEQRFVTPTTPDALFEALAERDDYRIVCGATDLGLDVTKAHARFPFLVSVGGIPELRGIEEIDSGWSIGATTRLADIESWAGAALPPLARMLRFFGARQLKNGGTLGGNICNASPIGDMPPVLLALEATLVLRSRSGERRVPIDEFFLAYRKTALKPGEILARIEVPRLRQGALAASYKVSKRRELDISAVCACFVITTDHAQVVTHARLAFGGMAATPKRATLTESALVGQVWSEETLTVASRTLDMDFQPLSDHRGSAWYRATVARNLLLGFYEETSDPARAVGALPDRPSGTVVLPAPGGGSV